MNCCGINSYKDWASFTYGNGTNVADGCCRNQTAGCGEGLLLDPDVKDLVYTRGCLSFVTKAFDVICLTLGILTFALVCVQVRCVCVCVLSRNAFFFPCTSLNYDYKSTEGSYSLRSSLFRH